MTVGQKMIFNRVLVNDGRGYDASTGVFTCPATGTYFFAMSILNGFDELACAFIMKKNDIEIIRVRAHAGTTIKVVFLF